MQVLCLQGEAKIIKWVCKVNYNPQDIYLYTFYISKLSRKLKKSKLCKESKTLLDKAFGRQWESFLDVQRDLKNVEIFIHFFNIYNHVYNVKGELIILRVIRPIKNYKDLLHPQHSNPLP